MFVSLFKKKLVKFIVAFCFLYNASGFALQDAVPKVTLKNGVIVEESWVAYTKERLEGIKDHQILLTLAEASKQQKLSIKIAHKDFLQKRRILIGDKFTNPKVRAIIACSIEIDPKSRTPRLVSPLNKVQPVWVRLSDDRLVDKALVDKVTAKLKKLENLEDSKMTTEKSLRHLSCYSTTSYWELPALYRDLFVKHDILKHNGKFPSKDVRAIIAQSIAFNPNKLINPLKQEAVKVESPVLSQEEEPAVASRKLSLDDCATMPGYAHNPTWRVSTEGDSFLTRWPSQNTTENDDDPQIDLQQLVQELLKKKDGE